MNFVDGLLGIALSFDLFYNTHNPESLHVEMGPKILSIREEKALWNVLA